MMIIHIHQQWMGLYSLAFCLLIFCFSFKSICKIYARFRQYHALYYIILGGHRTHRTIALVKLFQQRSLYPSRDISQISKYSTALTDSLNYLKFFSFNCIVSFHFHRVICEQTKRKTDSIWIQNTKMLLNRMLNCIILTL